MPGQIGGGAISSCDIASVLPNPRMQPTGRGGPQLRSGTALLVAKQWKRCFVWACPEGLQLLRMSLGRRHPRLESEVKSRIMYIENKAAGLSGSARIGRVTFSKTGKTLYYQGRTFQSLKGCGFKANYVDVATGEEYWISGPKKDGTDRLYGGRSPVEIDDEVREEYWRSIRGVPADEVS
jgi:hypothetical protein